MKKQIGNCLNCGKIFEVPRRTLGKYCSNICWVTSSERKKIVSEKLSGKPKTELHKEHMRGPRPNILGALNPAYGLKRPDLVAYNKSAEHRRIAKQSLTGKKKSIEHCAKLSESHKLFYNTPKGKAILRESRSHVKIIFKDTKIELSLCKELASRGVIFEKQKPIKYGLYGVTFPDVFIKPNICIYADGEYWHSRPGVKERDERINNGLALEGYKCFRYSGNEIKQNVEGCIDEIEEVLYGYY